MGVFDGCRDETTLAKIARSTLLLYLLMVDLQILHAATSLASPVVALQYLAMQRMIGLRIKAVARFRRRSSS